MNKLEKELLEDLKEVTIYVAVNAERLKHDKIESEYTEYTEQQLQHKGSIKQYLEKVLGVTYVWSDNRSDWIPIKAD